MVGGRGGRWGEATLNVDGDAGQRVRSEWRDPAPIQNLDGGIVAASPLFNALASEVIDSGLVLARVMAVVVGGVVYSVHQQPDASQGLRGVDVGVTQQECV